ncbi:hypothetical protein WICPIJ_010029 [Wickerhamomyces pijperi]|uniref:Uncharacterized protein n=1 Tax=Wickerhamomyces pijperi TaxID=599730 RepID=A0A9P8PJX5_WICPI|nr:hypothetical protein WICPIJ_010029 [Wickerhamomyces pijperi]
MASKSSRMLPNLAKCLITWLAIDSGYPNTKMDDSLFEVGNWVYLELSGDELKCCCFWNSESCCECLGGCNENLEE